MERAFWPMGAAWNNRFLAVPLTALRRRFFHSTRVNEWHVICVDRLCAGFVFFGSAGGSMVIKYFRVGQETQSKRLHFYNFFFHRDHADMAFVPARAV